MPKYVPNKIWERYSKIVYSFVDRDAGLQLFQWLKKKQIPLLYGEDSGESYYVVELNGLFSYNHIKTWPYNKSTPSGKLDNTNVVLYITKAQLAKLGYINEYGYWDFDNVSDKFIVEGKVYRPSGDTPVAQAKGMSLMFFVVLEMEDAEESVKILKQYKPITPETP